MRSEIKITIEISMQIMDRIVYCSGVCVDGKSEGGFRIIGWMNEHLDELVNGERKRK